MVDGKLTRFSIVEITKYPWRATGPWVNHWHAISTAVMPKFWSDKRCICETIIKTMDKQISFFTWGDGQCFFNQRLQLCFLCCMRFDLLCIVNTWPFYNAVFNGRFRKATYFIDGGNVKGNLLDYVSVTTVINELWPRQIVAKLYARGAIGKWLWSIVTIL